MSPRRPRATAPGAPSRSRTAAAAFRPRLRPTSSTRSSPRRTPEAASGSTSRTASSPSTVARSTLARGQRVARCSRSASPLSQRHAMPAPAEPRGRAVLPPLAADPARAALSPPRLPASCSADVALAEAAGAVAVPVRLQVPVAGGRTLLARALHRASGRGGPLVAPEGRWSVLGELPAGASVLIHAEALTPPAVPVLESLIDDGAAWLLVCSSESHPLPSVLAPRLEAVTVRVPPLGARLAELPDLARHLLAVLHARRGGSPPALMDDAVAHLTARPWPGDVGELEAVLARAMLRAHGGPIATRHLTGTDAPVSAAIVPDARRAQLEYLIADRARAAEPSRDRQDVRPAPGPARERGIAHSLRSTGRRRRHAHERRAGKRAGVRASRHARARRRRARPAARRPARRRAARVR